MSQVAHAERAHAKLSASGSSRWMACPGSVQLESFFSDTSSSFADEGTAAHELSELILQLHLGAITKRTYNAQLKKHQEGEYYSQEMQDYCEAYVDIVMERVNAARAVTPDAEILLEQRLDFSEWVPEGFGTGDVLIITDTALEVIDLKYGKGVPVSAINNPQLRLYGLGAYSGHSFIYSFEKVRMTIVQPRLDSVSTEELTVDDLLHWAADQVKPKAAEAASGKGSYAAGDHCRFCKARTECRTRAMANLELAQHEFKEPPLLSIEELAEIRGKIDALVSWAGDVKDHMLDQAEKHGIKYPGWKLVEGRSNRVISDKDKAKEALLAAEYDEDLILTPRELLAMGALEKVVGKKNFAEILSDLIVKPTGKPTLVEESDKRPELSSAASAASDFAEE